MTPVPFESIGTQWVYRARREVHAHIFTAIHSSNHSESSSFIELSLCVKSQKSHSEFQAVKTEAEYTIFAIAAMFV